jgi:hypothetical protein
MASPSAPPSSSGAVTSAQRWLKTPGLQGLNTTLIALLSPGSKEARGARRSGEHSPKPASAEPPPPGPSEQLPLPPSASSTQW